MGALALDTTLERVNAPVDVVVVKGSPLSSTLSLSRSWKIVAPATYPSTIDPLTLSGLFVTSI